MAGCTGASAVSERIVQLTAADFEEAMDLLNYAFAFSHGPHDFPALLPKVYRPTDRHMGCNYAIRRGGRLAAMAGVFPLVWRVGGAALRVAGIGGVSTHPRHRGAGLMTTLMRHCVRESRAAGYALSFLTGRRRRYGHFGYERCGTDLRFTLERDDLQAAGVGGTRIGFRRLTGGDPLLPDAIRLHAGQRLRCERAPADFVAICSSWNNRPYAAVTGAGLAGYLIAGGDGAQVTELLAADAPAALRIAAAWCEYRKLTSVTVAAPPARTAGVRALDAIAESMTVRCCGNWRVFDWPAVLSALLDERADAGEAESGSVVLQIGDAGRLHVHVDGAQAHVEPTDEPAQVTMQAMEAMRSLFGPLRPSWPDADAASRRAAAWFPLPLHLPHADWV